MPDEALASESSVDSRRGQSQLVIDPRFMPRRTTHLYDLGTGGRLQHTMPDLRRLKNAVARVHNKGRSLTLVHNPDPAGSAIDHLKQQLVIVDVIRDLAAVWDTNM